LVVKVGVATMVDEMGDVPAFTAVNGAIFPVPDDAIPITWFVEVHVNTVPT
jgi:hypothetical protein